jgi:hypothetical protein
LYANKHNFRVAAEYVQKHINNRNRNTPSIYNLHEVKKDLSIILKDHDPRED